MLSRSILEPNRHTIQWVPGNLSPGVKRQWREADHSPPANAEVNKTWIYTSTPPYAFMALPLLVYIQYMSKETERPFLVAEFT
jgi:hypothetical protein